MSPLPSELDLTPEQLKAIGCVAVESARVDLLVERIILIICNYDFDTGKMYTDRLELGAKLNLLRQFTFAKIEHDEARTNFQRIYDGLKNVLLVRDTIIHRRWKIRLNYLSSMGPFSAGFRAGRGQEKKPMRPDKIMSIAKRLYKLHGELWNFYRLHAHEFIQSTGESR